MLKTLNVRRLSAAAIRDLRNRWLFDPETITSGEIVEYPDDVERPKTRDDCVDGPRPCPFASCRFHLYLDVSSRGSIKINFPRLEVWDLPESCALDIADRNGASLPVVAAAMGLSYDRTFQVVDEAKKHATEIALDLSGDDGPWGREARKKKK